MVRLAQLVVTAEREHRRLMFTAGEPQIEAWRKVEILRHAFQTAVNPVGTIEGQTLMRLARQSATAAGHNYPAEDLTLNPEELEHKYSPEGGGQHPFFDRAGWITAVARHDTVCGYWDWVYNAIQNDEEPLQ